MYCVVIALFSTETGIFSDTGTRLSSSLAFVQVTLVAGPPVDIKVRMECVDMETSNIVTSPAWTKIMNYVFSAGPYYICTSSLICISYVTAVRYVSAINHEGE